MTKKIEPPQTDSGLEAYRFSLEEYYKMAEVGILNEDSRVELIYGKIVAKSPVRNPHMGCVNIITEHLASRAKAYDFMLSVQNPMRVDDFSEPEPDLVLFARDKDFYTTSKKPSSRDALLVIEVSDTTLRADQGIKKKLYVTSGVPEYLIVNLQNRRLEHYTEPTSDGQDYGLVRYYEEDTIFEHALFGQVAVNELLPAKFDAPDHQD